MVTSKLSSKAQTTVPQAVRAALGLREGDELLYEIDGEHIVLKKVQRAMADDPFACFDEWAGDADRKAYADL
ncbi:MAG: AbrB/MazE/SpoVT family DNA-binding domain-containing protein [Alphaproteobacteria bacterium]|nr:AbrB/MazE/SpoVT family DNA-binding domain-containing protein [Alphaproteobacteria bacterium]MBU1539903.1 AbrB/MazE/SpoVT family DNA-binding domain-containing protein [Alphaproteobacteria bacterium]MBU2378595.1 AbrB/MazE/SpoVT family DNA-binding domain-containing protein [Alphaproteobacteria bacterium]